MLHVTLDAGRYCVSPLSERASRWLAAYAAGIAAAPDMRGTIRVDARFINDLIDAATAAELAVDGHCRRTRRAAAEPGIR